ncbi:GNAT family N-acetyltransferase [Actinoplanes sp. NPDC051851]|uniref:GNAT family N-acetyltransferase n=1 Tax=Actinoplanes sp. NPDC051851 TaxID=3154753 RepID=UPI003449BB15
MSVLDNPAWESLQGSHARFAEVHGQAARYRSDVAPFHALADPRDPQAWSDLAELIAPATTVFLSHAGAVPSPGWEVERSIAGVQLVDVRLESAPDPTLIRLGESDVPDVLDLIRRTAPGPYLQRTIELGTYLGRRADGKLVAMAGERLRPDGWTEISAVCTAPEFRGQGLASRLVKAVAAGIRARGETPFLHTGAANTTAIRLYEHLGFTLRREVDFTAYRRV